MIKFPKERIPPSPNRGDGLFTPAKTSPRQMREELEKQRMAGMLTAADLEAMKFRLLVEIADSSLRVEKLLREMIDIQTSQ